MLGVVEPGAKVAAQTTVNKKIGLIGTKQLDDVPDMMLEQSAPFYIKQLYEKIGIDTDAIETHYILNTGGKMLALAGLCMAASVLVGLLASRVGASVGRGLRRDVFRKVVGFSNGEFDKFSTASLITRSILGDFLHGCLRLLCESA